MVELVTQIDDILIEQWESFVRTHPQGSVFQSYSMFKCYLETDGHEPLLFVAYDNGKLVGILLADVIKEKGLIKSKLSSRSIIIAGPLAKENDGKIVNSLLESYNSHISHSSIIYTQIRNLFDRMPINDAFQMNGYRFEPHLNYLVKLDSEENIWGRMGKGRLKQIKKAQKNELEVLSYPPGTISDDLIQDGYEIIKDVYQHAGLPLTDVGMLKHANGEDLLTLFVVRDKCGNMIGCRFALVSGSCLYGWYAGSYHKYYSLYPNDLLIWETLKWGCAHGFKYFDYGGAGNPNKHYGVRDFKAQAGGELVNYGRYQCVHKKLLMSLGRLGLSLYKKIMKK